MGSPGQLKNLQPHFASVVGFSMTNIIRHAGSSFLIVAVCATTTAGPEKRPNMTPIGASRRASRQRQGFEGTEGAETALFIKKLNLQTNLERWQADRPLGCSHKKGAKHTKPNEPREQLRTWSGDAALTADARVQGG